MPKLIDSNFQDNNLSKKNTEISKNIIKALNNSLFDDNDLVKEAAAYSLGFKYIYIDIIYTKKTNISNNYFIYKGIIGLPEAIDSVDYLLKSLNDNNPQVKATAIWSLGRLGKNIGLQASKKLIELLRDHFWKVRSAACIAIGNIGPIIADEALPHLTKILKDGTINKQTVCETIIQLGNFGEQILVDILKHLLPANTQLKSAIIYRFIIFFNSANIKFFNSN